MKRRVVDVTIQVTCLEDDAETVARDLDDWFCRNDTPLVQRPGTGGIRRSEPRPMRMWMRETFCPEGA